MTVKDIQKLCHAYKNDSFVREQINNIEDSEKINVINYHDDKSFTIVTDKTLHLINTTQRQIKLNNELSKKRRMSYGI